MVNVVTHRDDTSEGNVQVMLFEVFLSHSAKDKAVVRPRAERLCADGPRRKVECSRRRLLRRNSFVPTRASSGTLLPLELKEQTPAATLARKLGTPAHVSGLAIYLARLTGAGDRLPEWLLKVAVKRGAAHYQREFDPSLPPDQPMVSDEEIGIGLCLGQLPYHLDNLRAAAQLLSSPRVDAARLCRLAVRERCEPVLCHIAAVAERFAPALEPWAYVRQHLSPRPVPQPDALPHWTRLVSHTGLTAHGGSPQTNWLCRREQPAAHSPDA